MPTQPTRVSLLQHQQTQQRVISHAFTTASRIWRETIDDNSRRHNQGTLVAQQGSSARTWLGGIAIGPDP